MNPVQINVSRIETPRGHVEFAVAGSGPPILYFHGTPCSSSLAIEMEQQLIADGFQLVVPQRPGYYGTPLGDRLTTADCAEMAAHVLDHLEIDRVAGIGTSGGGPPVLAFAARYPERTAAVILQCAQSHCWDDARWAPAAHPWLWHCFRHSVSRRLFCRFFPTLFRLGFPTTEHYLRGLAGAHFSNIENVPAAQRFAAGVYDGLTDFRHVRAGYENDVATWSREDVLSKGEVTCPTLLLYDRQDPQAPFCHAESAAARISNAELVELDVGGHLIWYGPDANLMQQRRTAFLREHLAVGSLAHHN
jgi:pimeloyl-ACP methyl ester carboxylesterase